MRSKGTTVKLTQTMVFTTREKHQSTFGRRQVLSGESYVLTLNQLSTTWFALLAVTKKHFKISQEEKRNAVEYLHHKKYKDGCLNNTFYDF